MINYVPDVVTESDIMIMEMHKYHRLMKVYRDVVEQLEVCKFKTHHDDMWKRGLNTYEELYKLYNRGKSPR